MKTLRDFDLQEKTVLVRCDFNVPLDEKGNILDDFRIEKTLPTIKYLKEKKAKIILMSHLGRPEEAKDSRLREKQFSLRPVAIRLSALLKEEIKFLPGCIGKNIAKEVKKTKPGKVILLENLRFYREETEGDLNFAKELAQLADFYFNDAFAVCHRAHASVVGITKYLPSGAGSLLAREIKILSKVLQEPWHPLVVIIGGVKIDTKIKTIEQFLKKADHLLLGGEISNIFLRAKGVCVGKPLPEKEVLDRIERIQLTDSKLHLPIDSIISLADMEKGIEEGYFRKAAPGLVRKDEEIYDLGPETIKVFSRIIREAKMILWNGPMGVYEKKPFEAGTREIARAVIKNYPAFTIVGGGDTVSAVGKFGVLEKIDHVSTGGGAMLDFLSGEKLPGLEALKK